MVKKIPALSLKQIYPLKAAVITSELAVIRIARTAVRLCAQQTTGEKAAPPSIYRVLYRPWIFATTPFWEKFENPRADLRKKRGEGVSPKEGAPKTGSFRAVEPA
jgi:hypothetical protein